MKHFKEAIKNYIKNLPFGETVMLPAAHYGKRWLNSVVRVPQRIRAATVAKHVSVTSRVIGRVSKLAYGLRLCNYKVVLLHSDPDFCRFDSAILSLFDEAFMYNSPEDAVTKAALYRPIAYHIICIWDYNVARMFVQMRPGVVVVDTKDVLGGFVRPQILKRYPLQEKVERFCFENADGICCSDLRTQYLKRHLGYRLSPRLFWPDYCWPAGFMKRLSKKSDRRHVALVGSIEVDPSSPVAFSYNLARLLAQVGIHYHIFPSYASYGLKLRQEMRNFLSADLMKYVHIHDTLSFSDLSSELSTCHAGILISNINVNYMNDHDTYYPFMGEYFLASKLFDYHEAGLLCLTQKMRLPRHIFPKNGAIREVKSFQEIVEIVSNMEIREIETEPKLRLDYHAPRLSEFYLRLYRQKNGV
jgi:hypothetical protein